jgi:hypothetical protein
LDLEYSGSLGTPFVSVALSLHLSNRSRQLNTNLKLEFDSRFARFQLEAYSSLYLTTFPDLVRLGLVPAP